MPDTIGADTDPDLSVAYRALERRRGEAIVQRDRISDQIKKLDAALGALQALAGNAPGPAAVNGQEAALPAPEPAQAANATAEAASKPPTETAKASDRKTRVIEFLLENSRQWFTAADIASAIEHGSTSATQRNAVSETLRRLLRRKAVQRDDTGSPAKYRAVPAALREILLAAQ
jgi:hypothetical protein